MNVGSMQAKRPHRSVAAVSVIAAPHSAPNHGSFARVPKPTAIATTASIPSANGSRNAAIEGPSRRKDHAVIHRDSGGLEKLSLKRPSASTACSHSPCRRVLCARRA
jgi:hypothetical protein